MSKLDLQTLQSVADLGVRFYVPLTNECGQEDYFASPEEILVLERNPEEFAAHAHGLTVEQYRE